MHIVFMGTPDFSMLTLKALVEADHDVTAVMTQSGRPKGRGKEMQTTPVKIQALEHKIPVYQPVKVRDESSVKALREMEADVFVVIASDQILPKSVLDLPRLGCMNIRASLLPRYRGAASIQWCVIDEEREIGITTMTMDMGLDIGDMLEKVMIPVNRGETGGSPHDKLNLAGGELILFTLKKVEEGTIVRTSQTEEGICYARMLTKFLGNINWEKSAVSIGRLVRRLNPWPSVYTMWNGKNTEIWSTDVLGKDEEEEITHGVSSPDSAPSGTMICPGKRFLVVKTGEGPLSIEELQMEGKEHMDVDAFLRGYPVYEGDILTRKAE